MYFVPFIPPPPPSTRARELGIRLKETIDTFRQQYPDITNQDIYQAMEIAREGAGTRNTSVMIAIALGLVLLGLFAFAFINSNQALTWIVIVAGGIVLLGLIALLKNR